MADLASFLDKKKAKAAKKKGVRVDEMAKELESSVKIGVPEPDEPVPTIPKVSSEVNIPEKDEEDSEWIQFDSKPKAPLEGVGVFSYADAPEDEQTEEQRKAEAAENKQTWKKSEEPEEKKEEIVIPAVSTTQKFEQKPRAYQAPGSRHGAGGLMHRTKLDIKSEEMFPSIGDAERIMKEEKARAEEFRKVQAEDQVKVVASSRDRFTNDVRQTSTYTPPQQRTSEPPPPAEHRSYKGALRGLVADATGAPASDSMDTTDSVASPPPVPKPTPVAPRIVVNPETGRKQRGTGMFNARGDEIMEDLPEERPAPVAQPNAPALWRRSEATSNPPTVAAPTLPTGTQTTAAAHPHPQPPQPRAIPPSGTGVLNARGEPIVLREREENNPPPVQNWRSGPRTEQPPAQAIPPPQQPQQQQMWRRSEQSGPPAGRPQQHYQQHSQQHHQQHGQQHHQQSQQQQSDAGGAADDGWQTQSRQRQRPTKTTAPTQWRRQ